MQAAEAIIETEQASRYLVQLCRHAKQIGEAHRGGIGHLRRAMNHGGQRPELHSVEWTDTSGIVVLNWGQWTMKATPGTLHVRAEAPDADSLRRIEDLVTARLESFGKRAGLTVAWVPAQAPATETGASGGA